MKFVIFTFDAHGLPIAQHLKEEGHEVMVGVVEDKINTLSKIEEASANEDPEEKKLRLALFDGILDKQPAHELVEKLKKVKDPENYFLFFDFNNLFKFSEQLKDLGFHGNFPTEEDHLFEIDRDAAKEFVSENYPKLNIVNKREFQKVEDGIEFLKNTDDIWVLKAYDEGVMAFVPDVDDVQLASSQLIEALQNNKDAYESAGFLLELLIPNLIELTPEKLYYDGEPIGVTLDIENKQFGSGNISIQTGCAMDLVFPIDMQERICKIAFPPIVDRMARQHKGLFFWDASLLINKKTGKIYFGEFCSNRPGYNALFTELSQVSSVGDFFETISKKKNPFKDTVGSSVRIFNMNKDPETNKVIGGLNIGFKEETKKDIWLWDVEKKGKKLLNTGENWNLGVITGAGKSIDEAVQKLYKNVELFSFVGSYYRPKSDFLSLDYPTSILNRVNYGVERGLYKLPFAVKVADIKK